ncbi:uncharacterized protein A4U43_C05F20200 [Asparagus officinalis]|uniref:PTC1-like winged helix-turn-helix domain-containing protein n=1 Tax=Asparagus officinalis TaxID=4686 RepID=A0A5P1EU37_ASPOF|nr:uncharacterized protein A4U43_C05F20200 [Asparagus officinalis]
MASFGINDGPNNAVKFYYSKRKDSKELRRSALSRQPLCSAPAQPPPCSNDDELEIGAFYEIDHQKLPPKSPIHLKAVRIVKVGETSKLDVTVAFPSTYSLRNYFSFIAVNPASDQIPELDEMFVMSTNHAGKILRRKVPASQMEEDKHLQSFWLVSPFALPKNAAPRVEEESSERKIAPKSFGELQSALRDSGNLEWGIRRRVRYIGRYQSQVQPPSPKREDSDDKNETMEEVKTVMFTRKRARDQARKKNKKKIQTEKPIERKDPRKKRKKPKYENREKTKREAKVSTRTRPSKERWSKERYESAELKLLDIMRAKGALLGNPIMRQALRDEARKHIGDTGLLDHLLKHMAGKVVNDRSERFRRRHNADGAMEYWLEPADLDEVRKKAGVLDPYWLPPPGWKPGDACGSGACSCGSECQKEISELREEISVIKRDMDELIAVKQLEEEGKDEQQSKAASCDILQENYDNLLEKNKKLEGELAGLISTLKGVKEEMQLLRQEKAKKEEEEEKKKATEAQMNSAEDANGGISSCGNNGSEGKKKGVIRRSGFRICKPQGTFLWPNMAPDNNNSSNDKFNTGSPSAILSLISNTTTTEHSRRALLPADCRVSSSASGSARRGIAIAGCPRSTNAAVSR